MSPEELGKVYEDLMSELDNDRKIGRDSRIDKIEIPKDVMRYTLKAWLHENPVIWKVILKNLKGKAGFSISETTLKTRAYEARDRLFEYCQTIHPEAAAAKIDKFIDNEF